MVRAHNKIVREALSKFHGKEIKHTGDGIMTSFAQTSNGIDAAEDMQLGTQKHNANNPDLPLGLKIGLNAGEPIEEDNDLFGTTVQLAARIVDKAQAAQIFVSDTVYGICSGKKYTFVKRGPFEMKGFDGGLHLFELVWNPGGAAPEPDPLPTSAPEEEKKPEEPAPEASNVPDTGVEIGADLNKPEEEPTAPEPAPETQQPPLEAEQPPQPEAAPEQPAPAQPEAVAEPPQTPEPAAQPAAAPEVTPTAPAETPPEKPS